MELYWIKKIEDAARVVANRESRLLAIGRVERTIASYLAREIGEGVTGNIIVDPFYNKHHTATKILDGKVIELDIAVHERGTDKNNLAAIELETNNWPARDDIWKLEKLTEPLKGFGYQLGAYLVFGIGVKAGEIIEIQWFKGGKGYETRSVMK